jgi:Fe-S cluster biogenesis protein NfuA/nitrite reductase/ring-hydroxylating ferredoxin subunit
MATSAQQDQRDVQARFQKLEGLLRAVERIGSPDAQATVHELLQTLLELHGLGLERMLDMTYEADRAGQALIDDLAADPLVGKLLILHNLHPLGLPERVQQALDEVRPYMHSHGGDVELLDVSPDGRVHLRLNGSCHGCHSSNVTLKYAVEEAIYAHAPDVTGLQVEGVVGAAEPAPARAGFIPLDSLLPAAAASTPAGRASGAWVEVAGLSSLSAGGLRCLDVGGQTVLFGRVGEALYAYQHQCPSCGELLGQGRLNGSDLTCPHCGRSYDLARAGRSAQQPELQLQPYPLLVEHDRVRLAVPN